MIDKHFAEASEDLITRVPQFGDRSSVWYREKGRLWVYRPNKRKTAHQELVFHSVDTISNAITCVHGVKFYDCGAAPARETARIQASRTPSCCPRCASSASSATRWRCRALLLPRAGGRGHLCGRLRGIGGFHSPATRACPSISASGSARSPGRRGATPTTFRRTAARRRRRRVAQVRRAGRGVPVPAFTTATRTRSASTRTATSSRRCSP